MAIAPFSYSGDPSSSLQDYVRFEVQDTDSEAPLLTDGEIQFCIAQEAPGDPPTEGEVLGAAAHACEALARRFAMQADEKIGSLSVTYSKTAETLAARAADLRRRAAGLGIPFFGARTEAEKQAKLEDPNATQPAFSRSQFTNPYRERGSTGPSPVRESSL